MDLQARMPMRAKEPSTAYRSYVLFLLFAAHTFNFVDRQIINILAHPIQVDLKLNDTQIGLVTGLAFAIFYSVLGIPMARIADRPTSNRSRIISTSLIVWSAMTAVCGLAQNFVQLLLARIAVGVGEAGCTPPAHSLITDYFPPEKRASAFSIYGLGFPVGALLGLVMGGMIADAYGWRTALIVVGLPGALLGILMALTVRDPRRDAGATASHAEVPSISLRQALRDLLALRYYRNILYGGALLTMTAYGSTVFTTILFTRLHGLSPGQVGLWYGLCYGIAGIIGTRLGGLLGDRSEKRKSGNLFTVPALFTLASAPLLVTGYMHSDWKVALAFLFIPMLGNGLYYGPVFAAIQRKVPSTHRATAVAILLLTANLIGGGLGPVIFGMLSDVFAQFAGLQSIRWMLVVVAFLQIFVALFYWRSGYLLKTTPSLAV